MLCLRIVIFKQPAHKVNNDVFNFLDGNGAAIYTIIVIKYPAPTSAAVISVSYHKHKNPTPPPIGQTDNAFSLSHKLFCERTKTLSEEKKSSYMETYTPTHRNSPPSLKHFAL